MAKKKHSGGRPRGKSDTRKRMVRAARKLFHEKGYDATSVREIAGASGVDAAMVNHYFGGKEGLFQEVMELPVDPTEVIRGLTDGLTQDNLPGRIASTIVGVWEAPETSPAMVAMLRRALADPAQTQLVREFMMGGVLAPVAQLLAKDHPDDAQLRTGLIASQVIGLMTARHILCIEPVANLSPDQLKQHLEQTIIHIIERPRS